MPTSAPLRSSLFALAALLAVATGCGGSDAPPPPLVCGDQVVSGVEQCDDGNAVDGDGCDTNCTPTACGNGVLTAGEGCDDGNTTDGDGCSPTCQLPPTCGNGVREVGEACDGPDLAGQACLNFGFVGGTLGCTAACVFDTAACQAAPVCGNGILDAGEACDDQNGNEGDGCTATCQLEPGATCTGAPSVCTIVEWQCNDALDNDGDGPTDGADADCALPAYFSACASGESLLVLAAKGLPAAIEGFDAFVNRSLRFDVPGTATRSVVLADVAYPFTSQIFIQLEKGGTTAVLAQYPGFGADFTGTLFDTACSTAIGSGVSPFTGCYLPQQPMPANVPVAGAWTIGVASRSTSPPPGGQVLGLKLGLCVTDP